MNFISSSSAAGAIRQYELSRNLRWSIARQRLVVGDVGHRPAVDRVAVEGERVEEDCERWDGLG